MRIYNVKVPVVALVWADSEDAAVRKVTRHLAGRDVYVEAREAAAFESEPIYGLEEGVIG